MSTMKQKRPTAGALVIVLALGALTGLTATQATLADAAVAQHAVTSPATPTADTRADQTVNCNAPAEPGVNWSGCTIIDQNLSGADLTAANLVNTTFFNDNLTGARLLGADLKNATLTGDNVTQTFLALSNLPGLKASNLYNSLGATGYPLLPDGWTYLPGTSHSPVGKIVYTR